MKLNFTEREILGKKIIQAIDKIEPTDILSNFEDDEKAVKRVRKLKGDVDTNPEIKDFENDAYKLIKLSLRNMKAQIKQFITLWLVDMKKEKKK